MVSYIVSRIMVVGMGTLYPAYRSYKAIKSKDTKEYINLRQEATTIFSNNTVKWMMYWIVFAIFTTAEIFIDTLVGFWMPFYYEIKILFLFWLLSPTTKGSSILYKKFVHPFFTEHEKDIDSYIDKAKEQGYGTLVQYGKKGLDLAADTMMKTAISGQDVLVQQLKRYKSDTAINELGQSSPDGVTPSDNDNEETDGRNPDERQTTDGRISPEPTRERESSNFAPLDRNHAMSMDNLHMPSTMTSSSSLMYDSNTLPGRYYDGTDETLRSRPSHYYEGSATLPRYRHTHTTYNDYSSRPYESTSTSATSSDMTSSYTRYESSTLPRSRDSNRRYNTRNSRAGRY